MSYVSIDERLRRLRRELWSEKGLKIGKFYDLGTDKFRVLEINGDWVKVQIEGVTDPRDTDELHAAEFLSLAKR